jgi:hypothetical protein
MLQWRPNWRRWVIALLSAALVPSIFVIPLVIEFIRAVQTQQVDCGIDPSCIQVGMAQFAMASDAILFFGGFLVSSLVVYPLPRSRIKESGKNPK